MSVDALEGYGLERMNDAEIRNFLTVQGVGVLGLPNESVPYLLPMSYGFDGCRSVMRMGNWSGSSPLTI